LSSEAAHQTDVTVEGELKPAEISTVLAHYELGNVESIRTFLAGSARAPKARITCGEGVMLLKRLAPSRTDLASLQFQHDLIDQLSMSGLPVAEVIRSRENRSIVASGGHHFELVRWIDGTRYAYTDREAKACGAAMAGLHDLARTMVSQAPVRRGFHDRADVASALVGLQRAADGVVAERYGEVASTLRAARRVVRPHWASLEKAVAHGDWHPGNVLMGPDRVRGIIDFESVRAEPRAADVANGLLQFSLERRPGTGVEVWPQAADLRLIAAFAAGYQLVARRPLSAEELAAIPYLMIEALAVESVITIHRKGRIRKVAAEDVLPWIVGRLSWLESSRTDIIEAIKG